MSLYEGIAIVLLGVIASVLQAGSARAELREVTIGRQYSISQLQFMLMEHYKLLEKHAKAFGLGDIKVTWAVFGGGASMNDALLSGNLQFGSAGVPPFITLWARTANIYDVKGISGISSSPIYLNTRNPNLKTVADLGDRDKIALPAVKVSNQAIVLQMAAARIFGEANYARFDRLTVSLPNPDGMAALFSERGEINSHFTVPPYQYLELKNPVIRTLLNSYDVLGGATTLSMAYTTRKFREENPRIYKAFIAAMEEATALISNDKKTAAEIYLRVSKDKRTALEDVLRILNDPQVVYTLTPQNTMKYVEFMYKVGTVKTRPQTWKDLFFPEVHGLPGS